MRLTRRDFAALSGAALAAPLISPGAAGASETIRSHGSSLLGDLKYGADFTHFASVNPDAPKGGVARLATSAGFDSFNPFIVKGNPPIWARRVFDTLFAPSLEEGSTDYGLIAEWIERPKDFSHVDFRVRDEAHWHDGRPITVEDVIFSLDILKAKGDPQYRLYYANVTGGKDMGDNVVRFEFDVAENRELPQIMGQLPILPKHWWEGRAFDESGLEPLLGSGPYKFGAFELSRFIEYERVEDYWAADLPVNKGQHNFDRVRFEVFLDGEAAFEGFKSGEYDYRDENSASKWAEKYDFPAVTKGHINRLEFPEEGPKVIQAFAFNLRRAKFQDRRVREAIGLMYDFEWTNRTIYFGQYARVSSYFQGTESLTPAGAPEGAELAMLDEIRDKVPAEVFGPAWTPPKTDGSGRIRRQTRRATALLKEAGYEVKDGVLVGPDGAPFRIAFLTSQSGSSKTIDPFISNLKRLGVEAELQLVDRPQFIRRVLQDPEFDWDIIVRPLANSESPGNEQREFWGSEGASQVGGRNIGGVADPAVDALIERIIFAKDRAELEAASKALDRVLMWNHYLIPQIYTPFERLAWWDRFGHPDPLPARTAGFPTVWWWDEEKAAALEAAQ